jgi:hypothetical protein
MLSGNLLATKLFIPPPVASLIHRPRLLAMLDEGLHQGRRLTLPAAALSSEEQNDGPPRAQPTNAS